MKRPFVVPGAICSVLVLATLYQRTQAASDLPKQAFGKTSDGKEVFLYTLKSPSGMTVKITNYGGTVTQILVPDRSKKIGDVVLGFDSLDGYTSKETPR